MPATSREYGQPVFDIVWPALKNTLVLTISGGMILHNLLAILLGIFSAVRQYSIGDLPHRITFIAYCRVPAFWLA